jgi:hypothetical protein
MQAVLKTNKSSDRRAVDDGTFALFKQVISCCMQSQTLSGLWQWFYPIFLCAISRGSRISFNTGIVKGIIQSPKSSYGFSTMAFTSALFETSLIK